MCDQIILYVYNVMVVLCNRSEGLGFLVIASTSGSS